MSEFNRRTSNMILAGISVGMIAGGLSGWFFGERMVTVKWLGDLFLNGLKMIIVPLTVASMIVGISNLEDIRKLG